MEKISIFNYEAYYLDYLEGNLSIEDEQLLMDFLREHPECRLNDEELPTFGVEELQLGDKSFLKHTADIDPVTLGNVDHFMIAEAEGIISPEKQAELDGLISKNPHLSNDRKLFHKVYFKADETIGFGDKSELKKSKSIALWPYWSGVAAAILAAVFFVYQPSTIPAGELAAKGSDRHSGEQEGAGSITQDTKESTDQFIQESSLALTSEHNTEDNDKDEVDIQERIRVNKFRSAKSKGNDENVNKDLDRNPVRPIVASFDGQPLMPVTTVNSNPLEVKKQPTDIAYTDFSKMRNPIEPITRLISEKTKTEVDFRQEKSGKSQGFYIKVGKFELSRKKH